MNKFFDGNNVQNTRKGIGMKKLADENVLEIKIVSNNIIETFIVVFISGLFRSETCSHHELGR